MNEFAFVAFFAFTSVGFSDPTGENTCRVYYNETKQINVTYHQQVRKSYTESCWETITFRCVRYKSVVEVKWKTENITRLKMKLECCDGYQETDSGSCRPVCSSACVYGTCVQPETCSCDPGYTGDRCQIPGCPNGGWGQDCSEECSCQNGGFCHHVHGACTCASGFHGVSCQSKCPENTYGAGCQNKCSCDVGTVCNHVTGDCIPCQQGYFGEGCKKKCACLLDATEFCNPSDGKCFCKQNRFGLLCEKLCPFGFINNTCYTTPVRNDSCQCANHLYVCDLEKGCVCPEGINCGIQLSDQVVELSALAKSSDSSDGGGAAVPVVIVLLVSLLVIVLLLVYYRRRMKVLKTDLENRSVRWFSHPQMNPSVSQNEYVIQDEHPLGQGFVQNNRANNIIKQNNLQSVPILNNQLSFSSQHYHGENPVYRQYHDVPGSSQQYTDKPGPSHHSDVCGPALVHEKNVNCAPPPSHKLDNTDSGKCEELRVDLGGEDKLSCQKGLTVDLGGEDAGGRCDHLSDLPPLTDGHHSAAEPRDINILSDSLQEEKVVKPSVSLTFKNNLRDEQDDNTPGGNAQNEEMCGNRNEDDVCCNNTGD